MREKVKKFLKFSLAAVLLAGILYSADPRRIYAEIINTDILYYTGASVAFLTTLLAAGKRWQNLSSCIGSQISLWIAFRLITISYGFNLALPGNSGDLVRSKIQKRYIEIEEEGKVLGAVAAERGMDFLGLTIVSLVSLSLISTLPREANILVMLLTGLTASLGIFFYLNPGRADFIGRLTTERIGAFVNSVLSGISNSSKKNRLENLLLTLYIWGGEAVSFYLLVLALNLDIGFWEASITTSLMTFGSAAPLTPAGLGIVEAIGAGLITSLGVAISSAVSLLILQRSLSILQVGLLSFLIYNLEELEIIGK